MIPRSSAAYNLPERVASYDADMEILHPNRETMVQVALEVLPFEPGRAIRALDIGVGTGYFTERFLRRFPAQKPEAGQVAYFGGAAISNWLGLKSTPTIGTSRCRRMARSCLP